MKYTRITKGEVEEYYLCQECAAKISPFHQKQAEQMESLSEIFEQLLQPGAGEEGARVEEEASVKRCSLCGSSYEDFKRKSLFGCPECYSVFSEELVPLLRRIHGSTRHRGKVPAASRKAMEMNQKLEEYERLLRQAVERQDYENAAVLRDKIRNLKKRLSN